MFEKWQSRINKKLRERDDEDITFKDYTEEEEKATAAEPVEEPAGGLKITASERDGDGALRCKIVYPESFAEVSKIADYILDGYTVFLNTENIAPDECMRMLDFLNGVTYTIEGYIRPVGNKTYAVTPSDVDISEDE